MSYRTSPGIKKVRIIYQTQSKYDKLMTLDKIKLRLYTYIGTWNVRTLRIDGKLEELTHEMKIYNWNVIGLSELRKKCINEVQTTEDNTLYYICNEVRYVNGVCFLVNSYFAF